jgi:hypothetical protein
VAGDQLAVPAQHGGRRDQEPEASADRELSGEGAEQGAVGPAHPRARDASLEYGELVAQDQDLDLVGASDRARSTIQLRSLENIW